MSTYNGSRFLEEQLNSIIDQDNNLWNLYIRDDGSTDNTMEIIHHYVSTHDNIHFLSDNNNKGAAQSFLYLLRSVESEFYMFCDQDDVWLSDKVSTTYNYFLQISQNNMNKALLVFSDAKVVDQNLNLINNSFWKFTKAHPQILKDNKNLIKAFNCAPGCTMFFGNDLKKYVVDYDNDILMHDWFLMLKAIEFGEVFFIEKSLLLYRQHSNNVLGANETSYSSLLSKLVLIRNTLKKQNNLYRFIAKYSSTNWIEYYYLKSIFNIKRFLQN